MDEELKKAIADFYTPEELVGLLPILSEGAFLELIDALEDEIAEVEQEIKEEMGYHDDSEGLQGACKEWWEIGD